MPGRSGLDVTRELRELRPDLPIVILSGFVTNELREEAASLGVRRILEKPTTLDDLARTVAEVVAERKAG